MYLGSDGTFVKDTWIDDKYLGPDGVYIKGYRDDRRTNKSKTGWVGYVSSGDITGRTNW